MSRTQSPRGASLVVAALAVLMTGSASATSALYLSDAEQASMSTAVVIATIGDATVEMSPVWNQAITLTRVKVDEVLYGVAPSDVVIEQMGGTLDGITVYIPGDARFEQGERCVLFLRNVDGGWFLTAMEQSKYRLESRERLGSLMVRQLSGGMFVRGPDGRLVEFHEPSNRPLKLLKTFREMLAELGRQGVK